MPDNDWRKLRLKQVVWSNPKKAEVTGLPKDLYVSFVPMDAVGEYGGLDLSQHKPLGEVSVGYTYFRDGDVIVAKITPCFENGKGALASNLRSGIGFGTTELHVLRPREGLDSRFLFYLTISDRFRKLGEASMYGAGGQKRISERFVEEYRAFIPPLEDQLTIASYLDRETARLDALIDKKRRLLDLLDEKRIALVTQAVTRGLDPAVRMKDSGVEWIGAIPEHWDVVPLKYLMTKVVDCLHSTPVYSEYGKYPAIRTADLDSGVLDLSKARRVEDAEYRKRTKRLQPRGLDIVYSREGERYGHAALVPEGVRLCLAQRMMHFRVSTRHSPQFLMWALNSLSVYAQASLDTAGATAPHVNVETVRNFQLAIPPRPEQESIASALAQEIEELAMTRRHVLEAISLLQEYRTALVSSAVSGKIQVGEKVPA